MWLGLSKKAWNGTASLVLNNMIGQEISLINGGVKIFELYSA
jgi:hypothetical protein